MLRVVPPGEKPVQTIEHVKHAAIGAMVDRAVDGIATSREELESVIEHVLDVARAMSSGELPLAEAARLTSPQTRFLTSGITSPKHQEYPALMALLDAVIASDRDLVRTRHGIFTVPELRAVEAKREYDTEGRRELVVFPVRYPAVYRRYDERGPDLSNPYAKKPATAATGPWWDPVMEVTT